MSANEIWSVSDPVAEALASGRPVVALETTVITHGLPHPDGAAAALECEEAVRKGGAIPATIGVIGGRIRVGLSPAEIEGLADAGSMGSRDEEARATSPTGAAAEASSTRGGVLKLNLSNLAARIADGGPGSTTVAATMFIAAHVGIRVFATGGIGGVHRGVQDSGDVSVDLPALARYPVAVVCAGAKAILDLPQTVEMLETLGVPVFGYRTDEFPAFYRRSSGLRIDQRYDAIGELARAVRTHFDLGLGTGVVVANPVPAESEMSLEVYERALSSALAAASAVKGREVTPFLLERMRRLTGNESLSTNRALLRHNAAVAGELAGAIARG